jgi:hypothetical protein
MADGTAFDGFGGPKVKANEPKKGLAIYTRFLQIMRTVNPAYGSITCEWPLKCPTDLQDKPCSIAFKNCYIQKVFLGPNRLATFLRLCAEARAYVEPLECGYYVSTNSLFNPNGVQPDHNRADELSVEIAKLIADVGWDKKR